MDRVRGFVVPSGTDLSTRVGAPNRQLKVTGVDTDGAFMVAEYVLTKDLPPHIHLHQHESFYVLDGTITAFVGADELQAGPGDFVFLPSDVPHALTATSDPPPTLLAIATPNASSGGIRFVAETAEAFIHPPPQGWRSPAIRGGGAARARLWRGRPWWG